jgi:hypothetical protein
MPPTPDATSNERMQASRHGRQTSPYRDCHYSASPPGKRHTPRGSSPQAQHQLGPRG